MIRLRAGIGYALSEAMEEGHCGLPVPDLVATTAKLIQVPPELIDTALEQGLAAGDVPTAWTASPASSSPLYWARIGIRRSIAFVYGKSGSSDPDPPQIGDNRQRSKKDEDDSL